jgi:hypothetical protein
MIVSQECTSLSRTSLTSSSLDSNSSRSSSTVAMLLTHQVKCPPTSMLYCAHARCKVKYNATAICVRPNAFIGHRWAAI